MGTAHRSGRCCALYSRYMDGARKIRDCTIIDAPPFFETAGREESAEPRNKDTMDEGAASDTEERDPSVFWGDNKGPVVMVWDGMLPGEQESTTGLSGESNPREVPLESERERIGNFRRPPFLNRMGYD